MVADSTGPSPIPRFYAFLMRGGAISMPSLCGSAYSAGRFSSKASAMDVVYMLLLVALVAASAGFLRLCARLERDK